MLRTILSGYECCGISMGEDIGIDTNKNNESIARRKRNSAKLSPKGEVGTINHGEVAVPFDWKDCYCRDKSHSNVVETF